MPEISCHEGDGVATESYVVIMVLFEKRSVSCIPQFPMFFCSPMYVLLLGCVFLFDFLVLHFFITPFFKISDEWNKFRPKFCQ